MTFEELLEEEDGEDKDSYEGRLAEIELDRKIRIADRLRHIHVPPCLNNYLGTILQEKAWLTDPVVDVLMTEDGTIVLLVEYDHTIKDPVRRFFQGPGCKVRHLAPYVDRHALRRSLLDVALRAELDDEDRDWLVSLSRMKVIQLSRREGP